MSRYLRRQELVEVADIFREAGREYIRRYGRGMQPEEHKAFHAIVRCRTAELGGHVERCDNCSAERISYNSCRNRHCPKCQFLKRERWLLDRQKDLLPIPYFHVVFTLPAELNEIMLLNRRVLYDLFFRSVADSLQSAAQRKLGARIGFISILHTWGQTLIDHPHIHCIVTGGGLSPDCTVWVPSRDSFFIHVKVLSRLFRGRFLDGFRRLHENKRLSFPGDVSPEPSEYERFIDGLYRKDWVVFCKKPFARPENLLRYLGRYTHRIAITNHRILEHDGESVRFQYRDRSDRNSRKIMKLSCREFIRRFMLHVLPFHFVKIRYYGLLANRNRRNLVALCRKLLNAFENQQVADDFVFDWRSLFRYLTGIDLDICQECLSGRMFVYRILPSARPP